MEPCFFPNPSILTDFSIRMVRGGFKWIDLGIAVILVFVLSWEHYFCVSKLAGMLYCWMFQNIFCICPETHWCGDAYCKINYFPLKRNTYVFAWLDVYREINVSKIGFMRFCMKKNVQQVPSAVCGTLLLQL